MATNANLGATHTSGQRLHQHRRLRSQHEPHGGASMSEPLRSSGRGGASYRGTSQAHQAGCGHRSLSVPGARCETDGDQRGWDIEANPGASVFGSAIEAGRPGLRRYGSIDLASPETAKRRRPATHSNRTPGSGLPQKRAQHAGQNLPPEQAGRPEPIVRSHRLWSWSRVSRPMSGANIRLAPYGADTQSRVHSHWVLHEGAQKDPNTDAAGTRFGG